MTHPSHAPAGAADTPWRQPLAACPVLTARGLSLRAGARELLPALDLEIRPGELWCLVGPNGVGKSTLMAVLAGLRRPDGGAVAIDGQALGEVSPAVLARQRAYLPQTVHDTFSMRVRDAVRVGRYPHLAGWGFARREDELVVEAALAALDLSGLAARDVLTLSGGERQRVALAAVLAQQAPLLLLDEPVSHLDLRHQILVLDTLAALARAGSHAVLVILHDLNLARRYASHALLMAEDGRALHGPAAEVLTPGHCSTALRTPIVAVSDGYRTALVADGHPDAAPDGHGTR
ncbi:ABC transporter ATP-binding protein [Cupriavidus sp. USMAA2-4]|uniref:ABC transporter ATP-binding protein n=1 Tax=Cupriavidus malaysiensis TaxID=367825 RepID=A0ABM6F793_9BURK|nr:MULTISPECIES: ABC transporter ATP-binding protein [Cupriavidus]AOY92960.1 ABC transporter ATP-binding protein [Cupriavidus sp. USMAA2-4]AOZ07381.1 ABC transporter ATP-binding protein [Cupriavidus malaysiensis]